MGADDDDDDDADDDDDDDDDAREDADVFCALRACAFCFSCSHGAVPPLKYPSS